MNKQYDDDFFDELDKTTDLLKSFKSHMASESNNSYSNIDDLYNELNLENGVQGVKQRQEVIKPVQNTQQKDIIQSVVEEPFIEQRQVQKDEVSKIEQEVEQRQAQKVKAIKMQEVIEQSKIKKQYQEEIEQQDFEEEYQQEEIEQEKTDINEIIDKINDSVKETKSKRVQKTKKTKKEKKQEKAKFSILELAFCSFSFLFIIGCIGVYGSRFMKYYKVYNPKSENGKSLTLLTTAIGKNSALVYEGSGLYMSGGEYVYKGADVNNYVYFSNMKWRIIKTNTDGTIDIVLDDYINTLSWANRPKSYIESDIHKYLNNYFIKYIDKDYLAPTTICKDEVEDLKKFSCEKKNEDSYVRLLSVNEFLNSKTDSTYISNEKDTLWLNTTASEKVWQINGLNLSLAMPTRALGVKPVVKLKAGVALLEGDGSKDNPFVITKKSDDIYVGSYVQLGTERFVVYDIDGDKLSLAMDRVIAKKFKFDDSNVVFNPTLNTSLAYILNTTYYNSLPYKDLIIDKEWNIGAYNGSYEDTEKTKVTAKVGLYGVSDLKFSNDLQDYFLINSIGNKVGLYGNETIGSNPNVQQGVRPAICIKKTKPTDGDGTRENPYKLGA